MERRIGEIFEYNGEWYQCIEAYDKCSHCDFEVNYYTCRAKVPWCSGPFRKDRKDVIFRKLKKVGEPYSFGRKLMQPYKLYVSPVVPQELDYFVIYLVDDKTINIEIKQNKEDMEENKTTFPKEDNALTRTVYAYVNGKISDKELIRSIKEMSDEYPYAKNSLKPFDLQAAKSGKPVCTRDGRKARIICFDVNNDKPIVAVIYRKDGKETYPYTFYPNGLNMDNNVFSNTDLIMLPEKKEGWVNVYKGGLLDTKAYNTRKEAFDKTCPRDYVDTVKIEWEE